jgi:hypothetical protein
MVFITTRTSYNRNFSMTDLNSGYHMIKGRLAQVHFTVVPDVPKPTLQLISQFLGVALW